MPCRVRSVIPILFGFACVTAQAACPQQHENHPLLGEYPVRHPRTDTFLIVQQNDFAVQTVLRNGDRVTEFAAPAGRNGREFVTIPGSHGAPQICFYSTLAQKISNAYSVEEVTSARPDEQRFHARMSEAATLWANGSQASRSNAIRMYEEIAAQATIPEWRDIARLYAADALVQRYQYEPALRHLEILTANPQRADVIGYRSFWLLAIVRNRSNDYPASLQAANTALQLAQETQRNVGRSLRRDIAEITNQLGEVHLSAGQFDQGVNLIQKALALSQNDPQLLASVYNNRGYVELLKSDRSPLAERATFLSQSLAHHFRAREFALQANDPQELAIIENNIASLFERVGDLRKAREHYEEALRLVRAQDDELRLEFLYRNLGHVYQYLGDYEKSERFTIASLEISERALPKDAIRILCRLGTVHRLQNRMSEAVGEHTSCQRRAHDAQLPGVEGEALYELAVDRSQQRDLKGALAAIERAVTLLPLAQDRDLATKVHAQYAQLLQQQGKSTQARQEADRAIHEAQAARYPVATVDALVAAMSISIAQRRTDDAMSYGERAMSAIESLHAHLDAERLGPAWSARTQQVYEQLALFILSGDTRDERRARQALAILDRGRAISLRQQLSAPPRVQQRVESSPLLSTLSAIANDHARATTQDPLPLAYYHAHDLLTRSRLAGISDVPVPAPVSVERMQSLLGSDETALQYVLTVDRAYVFVVRRESVTATSLGSVRDIERAVADVSAGFMSGPGNTIPALKALSKLILPAGLSGRTLVIVPHAVLNAVPFAALDADGAQAYAPLVQRFAVKMAPSLSAYFMQKPAHDHSHAVELAIFANPSFEGSASRVPLRVSQPLPSTQREAERLSTLFPPARTRVFTRSAASRANLLGEEARNARVLHIASHGHFDASSPDNVGFALSTLRSRARYDSGFVTLTELFTQPFNNELVVISGCDTAMGLRRGGEGLMSVSRAFIAQGAAHVVATLWAVSDQASAEFMPLFYSRLATTGSIADSLQHAQQQLRAKRVYADPFFWAPYQLTSVRPDDRLRFESE